ncbi:MAG: hypothetical protein LBQ77_00875 [Treponema sp.]|jgi:hypothetical protein|nr:hypothetical protein [Treponema sp.]
MHFVLFQAIGCSKTKPEHITYRDAQSYFSVFFDSNNRKPICRLYLTDKKKQIGILDTDRKESKFDMESIENIYDHSEALINIIEFYSNFT